MSRTRSWARRCAVQAIYQWQLTGGKENEDGLHFVNERDIKKVDKAYFSDLFDHVVQHVQELDECISPLIDRTIDEVDPVERAILRLGVCELKFHPEVPYRVVINEAVELAKLFGAEQGHKFINGVMDKVAASLRKEEVS